MQYLKLKCSLFKNGKQLKKDNTGIELSQKIQYVSNRISFNGVYSSFIVFYKRIKPLIIKKWDKKKKVTKTILWHANNMTFATKFVDEKKYIEASYEKFDYKTLGFVRQDVVDDRSTSVSKTIVLMYFLDRISVRLVTACLHLTWQETAIYLDKYVRSFLSMAPTPWCLLNWILEWSSKNAYSKYSREAPVNYWKGNTKISVKLETFLFSRRGEMFSNFFY